MELSDGVLMLDGTNIGWIENILVMGPPRIGPRLRPISDDFLSAGTLTPLAPQVRPARPPSGTPRRLRRAQRVARKARRRGEARGKVSRRVRAALAAATAFVDEAPILSSTRALAVFRGEPARARRACGCTEANCSGCIARTGEACHWIAHDLCSACQDPPLAANPNLPGYWRNETSGVLAPAVLAYLTGADLTDADIAALRAYLRQWIAAPGWRGLEIDLLRAAVDGLTTQSAIADWVATAEDIGIDPL